jgi:uncharacterized protein
MAVHGHPVIDMDSHLREYADIDRTYADYIDPAYREPFQRLSRAVAKRREAGLPTQLFMHPQAVIEPSNESRPLGAYDTFGVVDEERNRTRHQEAARDPSKPPIPSAVHWDPAIRLEHMDRAHIDISLMFPSSATSYCTLRDVGFESALHSAYHRFMAQYCAESDGRLRWAFTATMRDISGTIRELRAFAKRDEGVVGVLIPPTCPDGRLLDNPDLHPLFACAQDLDLPILVHGGVLRPPYSPGATELDQAGFIIRAVYQPWAGQTALSALIGGGVFDLFPRLRAAIFETGSGWVPWLLDMLDDSYRSRPYLAPNLRRPPSEVWADGRIFVAADPAERWLKHGVAELGDDAWLFTTDYPHTGSPWPAGVDEVMAMDLAERTKYKILGENAVRLIPRLASTAAT